MTWGGLNSTDSGDIPKGSKYTSILAQSKLLPYRSIKDSISARSTAVLVGLLAMAWILRPIMSSGTRTLMVRLPPNISFFSALLVQCSS